MPNPYPSGNSDAMTAPYAPTFKNAIKSPTLTFGNILSSAKKSFCKTEFPQIVYFLVAGKLILFATTTG